MKILITGSAGILGSALCNVLKSGCELACLTHKDADITDGQAIRKAIIAARPDLIIHTAAYTDVDGCELNPEKARMVNANGTRNIAVAARDIGAILVYISTDHVFDGNKRAPYIETDGTGPVNVYGRTKLEGERSVQELANRYIIIRTSWIFGKKGKGFIHTVLERAKEEKRLKIANDKFSTPTYNSDLAQAIAKIINLVTSHPSQRLGAGQSPVTSLYGVYHITNEGSCSWYEYAQEILRCAGIKGVDISPIKFGELNLPARRPMHSVLDKSKYNSLTGEPLRQWQDALKEYMKACFSN